ncbi:MAG: hypothetical protein RJB38_233 [Pseudomonadota bacterium]|jgi:hypothetical protein
MNRLEMACRWVGVSTVISVFGCVGGGSSNLSSVMDAIEGMKSNSSPVVEGYIQFPSADARWAGPVLWSVYASARDEGQPVFEVTPKLPRRQNLPSVPELSGRTPASALGMAARSASGAPTVKTLGREEVRERLQLLATSVASFEEEKVACVSAVKVRLTRADGSVLEKQACRGSAVWTQVASELAAEFMDQSRMARVPASSSDSLAAPAPASGAPQESHQDQQEHG